MIIVMETVPVVINAFEGEQGVDRVLLGYSSRWVRQDIVASPRSSCLFRLVFTASRWRCRSDATCAHPAMEDGWLGGEVVSGMRLTPRSLDL